jgi:hypothetical protein
MASQAQRNQLPHPDIEPCPGQQLDPDTLAAAFSRIQENFDELNGRFPVGGGDLSQAVIRSAVGGRHKIAFGTKSITWSGVASEVEVAQAHGLDAVPVHALATPAYPNLIVGVTGLQPVNIVLRVRDVDGAPASGTGSLIYWLAIL